MQKHMSKECFSIKQTQCIVIILQLERYQEIRTVSSYK